MNPSRSSQNPVSFCFARAKASGRIQRPCPSREPLGFYSGSGAPPTVPAWLGPNNQSWMFSSPATPPLGAPKVTIHLTGRWNSPPPLPGPAPERMAHLAAEDLIEYIRQGGQVPERGGGRGGGPTVTVGIVGMRQSPTSCTAPAKWVERQEPPTESGSPDFQGTHGPRCCVPGTPPPTCAGPSVVGLHGSAVSIRQRPIPNLQSASQHSSHTPPCP